MNRFKDLFDYEYEMAQRIAEEDAERAMEVMHPEGNPDPNSITKEELIEDFSPDSVEEVMNDLQ